MECILHPITKQIVKAHDFMCFEDWKEVQFIELINCEEILNDDEAILKGIVKETGEEFETKLSIKEYFDGKFFLLDLNKTAQQNRKTIIFENKELVIYKYKTVYRVHFFEDEHTFKTENTKSFITKNYDTVIRKLKELNININTNTKEHNYYYNINGLIFKDYIEAYNYCMKKHLNPYKIKRSTLLNNELQYLKNIINNKAG